MSKLVRFGEFSALELGSWLNEQMADPRNAPRSRHYLGTIGWYGVNLEEAIRRDKVATRTRGMMSYVAVEETIEGLGFDMVGVLAISRGLPLNRVRGPIPPKLARVVPALLHEPYPLPLKAANVSGWKVDSYGAQTLEEMYLEGVRTLDPTDLAWTVEPERADKWVHNAIRAAGFSAEGEPRRYDVGEHALVIPPVSQLYSRMAVR